jgi:hypothetical protein
MNPRASIEELRLQGNKGNLKRALKRGPAALVAKREQLEALFTDLSARRDEALADVKKNGMVLVQDKFSGRGALYQIKVINPAMKIAQQCERQLAQLARQLTALPATPVDPNAEALDSLHNMLGMKN